VQSLVELWSINSLQYFQQEKYVRNAERQTQNHVNPQTTKPSLQRPLPLAPW